MFDDNSIRPSRHETPRESLFSLISKSHLHTVSGKRSPFEISLDKVEG